MTILTGKSPADKTCESRADFRPSRVPLVFQHGIRQVFLEQYQVSTVEDEEEAERSFVSVEMRFLPVSKIITAR